MTAIAIRLNQRALFDKLRKAEASLTKVNSFDETTLLHTAVWAGHEDMVDTLLLTGLFVGELLEAQDKDGR